MEDHDEILWAKNGEVENLSQSITSTADVLKCQDWKQVYFVIMSLQDNFPGSMKYLSLYPQTKDLTTKHLSAKDIASASW